MRHSHSGTAGTAKTPANPQGEGRREGRWEKSRLPGYSAPAWKERPSQLTSSFALFCPPSPAVALRTRGKPQDGGLGVEARRDGTCRIYPISGLSTLCIKSGQLLTTSTKKLLPSIGSVPCGHQVSILNSITPLVPSVLHQQVRTLIKFSLRKGKRKTVKAVVHRFLRLHCGLWLRRRAGYKKRLWKKNARRRKRLREQVFCNKTQSRLLDKMTTSFWRRRNWYANDPFLKYHDRTNLRL
ncbi:39S ribosomal protein L35, mitochondrial [Sphaerodactylus townsendi]|uniref:Mitochondrial 54S ribosomal protein YmL35 n=1 Tax=Sphaerodactylus townsendi TaxID=933632 RepID=A0ACB8ETE8_9SAUR|nr:39S ribosomal protein L35, mitochondrial [Sphaerodactylus townsendi]